MRTWKLLTFAAIFALAFAACDEPVSDPVCECEVTAHLGVGETCDCGGTDCACTLEVYGTIEDNGGNIIPIYRKGEVLDMAAAVAKLQTVPAYITTYTPEYIPLLDGRVAEVRIIPGNERFKIPVGDGTYILEIGEERSAIAMGNWFASLAQDIENGLALVPQYGTIEDDGGNIIPSYRKGDVLDMDAAVVKRS